MAFFEYVNKKVSSMENMIYVKYMKNGKGIFMYPDYGIIAKAYMGKNGVTNNKVEGDGKTPLGKFKLGIILSRKSDIQNLYGVKHKLINKNLYWIDDVKSQYYNNLVDIETVSKKDWSSAEHLIEYPIEYEYLVEIKNNPRNIHGKGSAIFLHCSNKNVTAGCVAIDRNIMKKVVEVINLDTMIEIIK